jgi:hypothetical protein
LQGPKGDTGAKGDKGDTGAAGPKGDTGATGAQGPPGNGIATRRKTAAQSQSLATNVDVADLVEPVLADTRYYFRAVVFFTAAASTTGIGLGVNGPLGSTVEAGAVVPISTTAAPITGVVTALDGVVLGTGSATATPLMAVIEGTLLTGAVAGSLAIRVRSEVAGSAVTVRANSLLTVWK